MPRWPKKPINPALDENEVTEIVSPEAVEEKKPPPMKQPRSTLNHAKDSSTYEKIGGMEFHRQGGSLDYSQNLSLDIPQHLLNNDLAYRWVNDDEKGRLEKHRSKGCVEIPDGSFGKGISTRRRVGTQKDGSPLYAVLMARPKKWQEEDQRIAEKNRSEKEARIFSGKSVVGKDGTEEEISGDRFYNKDSKIRHIKGAAVVA